MSNPIEAKLREIYSLNYADRNDAECAVIAFAMSIVAVDCDYETGDFIGGDSDRGEAFDLLASQLGVTL